ncbi:hypothetical protein Pcinc_009804 [Petrolisthes cinctipes]|uniref:SGNH hydrolase-type esterase domain-containing protein n=1 Tax=Petrolisthes cinctipes TaxID=88211 RepID=A0AAE1KW02_PETCI|nr:hypothetical protein Pcinc_009804 [Petrolisthes cinctipes]
MAPQLTCSTCSGTFGPTIFANRDVLVCRFCNLREDNLTDLKAAQRKIEALSEKLETLQEFVTLNVGMTSTPTAPVDTAPVQTASTPLPPPAPPTTPSPREEFRVVRNNIRPTRNIIPITTCQNRFKILAQDDDEDDTEARLVGDSMVRGQLTEFCGRAPKSRKRFCIPGGGLDDVIDSVDEVTSLAPDNTTYVIHVGTNDVFKRAPQQVPTDDCEVQGKDEQHHPFWNHPPQTSRHPFLQHRY